MYCSCTHKAYVTICSPTWAPMYDLTLYYLFTWSASYYLTAEEERRGEQRSCHSLFICDWYAACYDPYLNSRQCAAIHDPLSSSDAYVMGNTEITKHCANSSFSFCLTYGKIIVRAANNQCRAEIWTSLHSPHGIPESVDPCSRLPWKPVIHPVGGFNVENHRLGQPCWPKAWAGGREAYFIFLLPVATFTIQSCCRCRHLM